jgi:hypothetical protein
MATLSSPYASDLLFNVRNMLNQPNATNSFWTDDELLTYINEGIRRYFTEVVQHMNGEFVTTATLDLTSGTDTIALPSDFFQMRALYRATPNGYTILQYRNNLTEGYATNVGGGTGYLPYYYLQGNSIVIRPVSNFSETGAFKIEYIQFPTTMVTGGDQLTSAVSPVFKDMVETYAVYKAKLKESLTNGAVLTPAIKQNLDDLYLAFKDCMAKRSYQPTYVQQFNPDTGGY